MFNSLLGSFLGGFSSWKSTLAGFVAFLALVLHSRGWIEITPEQQATIVAFALLVIGWVSKDTTVIGRPDTDLS
jgi:hypothetical protein